MNLLLFSLLDFLSVEKVFSDDFFLLYRFCIIVELFELFEFISFSSFIINNYIP